MTDTTTEGSRGLYRRLRHELVTPESIYGTLITSALIVIVEDGESDFDLLATVAATTFVFWIAHVFAFTVANHGKRDGRDIPIGEALGDAVRHSSGLLLAAILPISMLALGALGLVSESLAYYLALLIGVVLLFVLGLLAFAERGARWYSCLVAGFVTSLLGVAVILLKAAFH
ncbi:hypothetical protein [Herbiconiux sp. YIM B11900]|uniref:hypothetical protein n=1 Tax=Herbiconiux sp. YIM B11900 TaxID=3404131 RepID=UPI003F83F146